MLSPFAGETPKFIVTDRPVLRERTLAQHDAIAHFELTVANTELLAHKRIRPLNERSQ